MIPSGIVTTGWPAVERQCADFGDEFDEWQRGAGRVILGKRADDSYAATVGGITLSIPRQVAKTFLVGRIVFALCVLFPGLRVIWTAHRARTATNTFRNLSAYAKRAKVNPYIGDIRRTNGEQEIHFKNGSVILFGAREQGFGRGFDEIDIEVFDEAQILTEKALEDMIAATNQSRHEHGALLFFLGTPPRPVDPGEAFRLRRDAALSFIPEGNEFGDPVIGDDAVYIECSADPDAEPDDRAQWSRANPSYPHRTPERSMLRLRKNLPRLDSWKREGLGIWDEIAGRVRSIVDPDEWEMQAIEAAPADGVVSYGVKYSADGATVAVSAGLKYGQHVHVEGVHHRSTLEGSKWLVDWLTEPAPGRKLARWRECGLIVIDGRSGAGALVKALRKAKVPQRRIVTPTAEQVVTAHKQFVDAVIDRTLTHIGDEALDESVLGAARRMIGTQGGWGFQPIDEDVDVTLAESAVFAHYGAVTSKRSSPPPAGGRQPGRKAVVM